MDDKLLSTFDIARRTDAAPRTVQRWAHEGRISGTVHIGHQYRFESASVEAQLATGTFPKSLNANSANSAKGLT